MGGIVSGGEGKRRVPGLMSGWLRNAAEWGEGLIFFFQAEDGIRDGTVTGVQTCALPICSVVGERYVNVYARWQDFLPIIQDIKRVKPDVIFSTVVGEGTVFLYQAYANVGLDPRQTPIASLTTTEAEIAAMGFDVGEGHITAASYFQGIESGANQAFVHRFKKRFGADVSTNMCAEASYFQVRLFAKALEQVNTLDTEVLRSMVFGSSYEAPQGAVTVNPMSGHTDLWTRIGRANNHGQFDVVRQSKEAVHADPFLI